MKRFSRRLYKLASRLERELGSPQDIEWAVTGAKKGKSKLFLLQSRPITTLIGRNPATGEWNDSLTGDFLWTNTNFMEAVPDVMTPSTCSLVRILHFDTATAVMPQDLPMISFSGSYLAKIGAGSCAQRLAASGLQTTLRPHSHTIMFPFTSQTWEL